MINKIRKSHASLHHIILLIWLGAFLIKGIIYWYIGSLVPIMLATMICLLFVINRNNHKATKKLIIWWAIVLIIWGIIRLFIGAANYFVKPLTENHLDVQLGLSGIFISVMAIFSGIYFLKRRNQFSIFSTDPGT